MEGGDHHGKVSIEERTRTSSVMSSGAGLLLLFLLMLLLLIFISRLFTASHNDNNGPRRDKLVFEDSDMIESVSFESSNAWWCPFPFSFFWRAC